MAGEGCVYFIQSHYQRGTIKIGTARDPHGRLSKLQTGNPKPLRLLGYVVTENARDLERECHHRFKRVSGEWYQATDDLLGFIYALRKGEATTHTLGSEAAGRWVEVEYA